MGVGQGTEEEAAMGWRRGWGGGGQDRRGGGGRAGWPSVTGAVVRALGGRGDEGPTCRRPEEATVGA
jgi:hypothetical protein